jgi:hypothetical protein
VSSFHQLAERIAELAEILSVPSLSDAEVVTYWQSLLAAYPDIAKFLRRRFSRLPLSHQLLIVQLLQAAEGDVYMQLLQTWGQDAGLDFSVRLAALQSAQKLGAAIDSASFEQLRNVCQLSSQLSQAGITALMEESGNLDARWQDAVMQLPLNLAMALGRQLSGLHPLLGLAVFRALLPMLDAKDRLMMVDNVAQIALPESVEMLLDLLADTTEKGLQKAIKKALHRLRSQGLEVHDETQQSHIAVVGAANLQLEKCLASHIDAEGNRILWMARKKPFGGYNIAYLVINYGTGIQRAIALQVTKRELPELLEKAQDEVRLVDIDPAYCQYQVAMAHQMNLATRTPVPEPFFAMQDIIGETTETFEQAFVYRLLSASELEEMHAYTGYVDELLELPELAGWTLPMSIVSKYADMIREVDESQIIVSTALKNDRMSKIYAQASQEVLSEDTCRIMRLRLEETAYYLVQTDRRRQALWALAVAESLQQPLSTSQPHPFIQALLEESIDLALERPGGRIIQPFARPTRRTESRLII